jgi:hypothetical protein
MTALSSKPFRECHIATSNTVIVAYSTVLICGFLIKYKKVHSMKTVNVVRHGFDIDYSK